MVHFIQTIIFCFILKPPIMFVQAQLSRYWMKPYPYPKWFVDFDRRRNNDRHILMVNDIVKDVDNKMEIANRYVDMHKGSVNFELGFIAAGVKMLFKKMLRAYRKFADPWTVRTEYYSNTSYIALIHYMLGMYNMILHERRTFYNILNAHMSKKKEKQKQKLSPMDQYKAMLKKPGRPAALRELPNIEKPDFATTKAIPPFPSNKRKINKKALSDQSLKLMMRQEKIDKMRAGFRPEVEGIDVDLSQMM